MIVKNLGIYIRAVDLIKGPAAQTLKGTSPISYNVPFCDRNVEMCVHFCYKMVHCEIFVWCIVGFVGLSLCNKSIQIESKYMYHNSSRDRRQSGLSKVKEIKSVFKWFKMA